MIQHGCQRLSSGCVPHTDCAVFQAQTNWSYIGDWALFKEYADVLINMGTCE